MFNDIARKFRSGLLIQKVYSASPKFVHDAIYTCFGFAKLLEYRHLRKAYLLDYISEEKKTKQEIRKDQLDKLRELLIYAEENTEYYRNVFKAVGFEPRKFSSFEDLEVLPILTKEIIGTNSSELLSKDPSLSDALSMSSGGTTGTTLSFKMDKETHRRKEAQALRYWERHGYRPGKDKTIMFRAGVLVPLGQKIRKPWRTDSARKMLYLSSYYASDEFFDQYYEMLTKWRPKFMHFLPSAAYLFANFLNERGLTIPLEKAFSASEQLYDFQKDAIEKAFSCQVFDHYGHIEPGNYVAGQCSEGHYHICSNDVFVEVLEDGRIIETSLVNRSMPFIRYEIGDMADGIYWDCACGANTPYVKKIQGRLSELVHTADGRKISTIGFDQIFRGNNIRLGQIEQFEVGRFNLNLVVNESFTPADEERIVRKLQERVGVTSAIDVTYLSEIKKANSGKFNLVVSHLNRVKSRRRPHAFEKSDV